MFWEHVARQVGVPVAVLLREMVVDPLYLRVRDRFQGRGEQVAQTTTEDDEENLDESGDEIIAPEIEYDIDTWFPDGDIEITCNQFIPFVRGFEDIYGTSINYNSESSAWEFWCSMRNGCCHKEVENVVTNAGYGFTLYVFQTDVLAQQFTQEKMCWYTFEECTDANVTGISECLANNLNDPGACSSHFFIRDGGMWDEGHMTTVGAVGNIMNVYFMVSSTDIDTESSRQSVTDTIGLIIQIVQEKRSWQE
jgi:hypothetical protein